MSFNIKSFLNCFQFYETVDNHNRFADEGLTYSFTIADEQLVVDKVIDYNEHGNPEIKTMRFPLPHSFEEAIILFKTNDLCFLNICDDKETIEEIKQDYELLCSNK